MCCPQGELIASTSLCCTSQGHEQKYARHRLRFRFFLVESAFDTLRVFTGTFISLNIARFPKTVVITRGKNCSLAWLVPTHNGGTCHKKTCGYQTQVFEAFLQGFFEGVSAIRFPDYRATERTGGVVFEGLKKGKFDD